MPRRRTKASSESSRIEPLSPAEAERLAGAFKLLADPTRLRLLSIVASTDETCVCDLVGALDVSQPTVSHHMKLLKGGGLVEGEARGSWTYYRLVDGADELLRSTLATRI
ncbi:MAG: ArsR/SmtB family transcription factor [Acidimicrobiales bacterium]